MTRKKPRRGRPARAGKAATERIELRVTKLERAAWEHEAAKRGMSVSEWIRRCCSSKVIEDPVGDELRAKYGTARATSEDE